MKTIDRRLFLGNTIAGGAALATSVAARRALSAQSSERRGPRFGLVTYMWGANWDLPMLIANCEKAKALGVELRTTHAHGVEPSLAPHQRKDVKERFRTSPVTLVGLGSNERLDSPDPATLERAIEATKSFVVLSHDIGGSGVKVKPNDFHEGVPREKTIQQIGDSLNRLGAFAADYGQEIRLEVHGTCAELPTMRAILDVANHPSVGLCWNSNDADLHGEGLRHNFDLVRNRFGETCHVRRLDRDDYPFQELITLLVRSGYSGWVLLEATGDVDDRIAAVAAQRDLFDRMASLDRP